MRVPLKWLKELVDIDVDVQELANTLSRTGSAVDKIERFAEGVSGVVVGSVIDVRDVAESDKLCVAQIDTGSEHVQVLAGAKNFRKGDRVPIALPGARVTTLDVPVAVRKMMGQESQGMLCSAHELGVAEDHSGILVLPSDTDIGTDVSDLLGLDDYVLEFEIYPNRPDQMSVLGIAREVSVVYATPLRMPSFDVVETGDEAKRVTSVEIESPDKCSRYLARVIEGVTFAPSPALVMSRLSACGFRPLGNLVDATNYALLLTGQPLHAFDLDRLAEERIVVRRARPDERLTTLDGEKRVLEPEDLVIADAFDAQALAGVMGGAASEVGSETKRVLLESAYFEPIGVSRTARRRHMHTEASARFERGADPEMVPQAAALAAELMRTWAGGTVGKGAVDVGGVPERRKLVLRPERVEAILGIEVPVKETERYLSGLGCEVSVRKATVEVKPPSWRPDLEREIDLVEELARLHGYEEIPSVPRPGSRGGRSEAQLLRNRLRETLLGSGLSEATLSSFISEEDLQAIGYDGAVVQVSNPMTEEQRRLRPTLLPGLLHAAQRNVARGVSNVRLFEMGKIFREWPPESDLPNESELLGVVLVGNMTDHWSDEARPSDVFDLKGILEVALSELGIRGWELEAGLGMPFHPGRSANISLDGEMVGRFGELRPSVARAFDLDAAVVGGLFVEPLFTAAPKELKVVELATQPPVLRDISMILPDDVSAQDVMNTIRKAGGDHLESVSILDEYRGPQVGEGRRSLAFKLTFRAPDRTLRSEDADAARESIGEAVRGAHAAEIR
jgi:phenylalanyl-tRNA synthetase beta chain